MPDCSRCGGEGEETYDEDGRTVTDVCYHCAGSGKVDDDTHFHDRLCMVASALAYQAESECRKAYNEDPEGDGYDLGAYENGMMPSDYFRCRVWERTPEIAEKLSAMSQADQEFMVAWNEYIPEPGILERPIPTLLDELLKCEPIVQDAMIAMVESSSISDDDIPF